MRTGCPNDPDATGADPSTDDPLHRLVRSLHRFLDRRPLPYAYEVSARRPAGPVDVEGLRGHDPLGGDFVAMVSSAPEIVCTYVGAWPVLVTPALPATVGQPAIHRAVWVTTKRRLAVTAAQGEERLRLLGTILAPTGLDDLTPEMLSDARLPASWASEPIDIDDLAEAAKAMAG